MIRAIIVDDERSCIETLQWKIDHFCVGLEVEAVFEEPLRAAEFLKSEPVDLVFLDIEMPKMSGFDLLESLDNINFEVIFTTAFDQYGIRAVKFSALDYLLKPVRNKDLVEAVDRFRSRQHSRNPQVQIESLLNNLQAQAQTGKPHKITLATKESLELVEPSEIQYCESDSNYTMIYLSDDRKKLISRTLREFEDMLVDFNFCRVHNSFLVNMEHVRKYVKSEGGYLLLHNGKQVPVSKSKKERVLAYF